MFMRKVTVQNVICTQGLSLILVVLFSTYTEIETPFSFISIIKVTTVCDHRYLEKRFNIVGCWCILSTQWAWWVKFFCWPWEDSLPDDKKVQRSNRKALSFHGSKIINSLTCMVIWSAPRWLGDKYWHGRPIALWTACYYKASLENSLSGVYNIVLGFSVLL